MTPLPEIRVPRTGHVAVITPQADTSGPSARFVDWLPHEARGPAGGGSGAA